PPVCHISIIPKPIKLSGLAQSSSLLAMKPIRTLQQRLSKEGVPLGAMLMPHLLQDTSSWLPDTRARNALREQLRENTNEKLEIADRRLENADSKHMSVHVYMPVAEDSTAWCMPIRMQENGIVLYKDDLNSVPSSRPPHAALVFKEAVF